ncbi:cell wall elongation regulator TseB-like domain-containing protein [Halobacillus karajensis]|uniref:cell wall elongation regulator TseB-like domain-containing protein n=1 Tax=Halobacillus karajensis TaxID=195088 RepID=UPI000689ADDC|nr:DUF5590 domain-containing protein [Halobacillus karajensis]
MGIILFLILILSVWLYVEVNQDRTEGHEEAKAIAKEAGGIHRVDHVFTYHGEKEIHIVQGSKEEGKWLLFIDIKEKDVLDEVPLDDVLPVAEMHAQWDESCSGCTFKDLAYAFEENEPVYQLTYIDERNRYVMDYFTLNGEAFDQRFAFRQND